jgi:hypothetical protein
VYQPHWAFLPPQRPAGTIDSLVRARLAREGLAMSPPADPSALLRRVTFDLTGLPPKPEDLDSFLRDPASYERVVDRLLASSAHAERMAIRWLEAARYADTNGYQTDGVRDMYRYRDWVIEAYQRNLPFDQFTVEQIAGDLLPQPALDQRIATGFHRNHRTSAEGGIIDEEFRVEYVADRAETTATVWLGLTMGCARCHDHKYDPLPQRDFYRMFAFFNNVPEKGFVYNFGNEPPFIKAPTAAQQRRLDALDADLAVAHQRVVTLEPAARRAFSEWLRAPQMSPDDFVIPAGLVLDRTVTQLPAEWGRDLAQFTNTDPYTIAVRCKPAGPKGAIVSRIEDYLDGTGWGLFLLDGKLRFHHVFRHTDLGLRVETKRPVRLNTWQHIAVVYDGGMKAAGLRIYIDGAPQELNVLFDQHLWPIDNKVPLRVGAGAGLGFEGQIARVAIWNRVLASDEVAAMAVPETVSGLLRIERRSEAQNRKLQLCFEDRALPRDVAAARRAYLLAQERRDAWHATLPTVMVMEEMTQPRPAHILKRGAYDQPGEPVSAGIPTIFPQLTAKPDRLALARWLVSRDNPLTARVQVNRFWQMLFGIGLVKTVEDFGSQGEWPVCPELLDLLAVEFMDSGWNVRHILKTIVMSDTYRQSSRVTPALLERDPENRLLARGPRFRLPAEMIRDQALAASGLLVDRVGGPSVKPYQPPGLWKELQGGQDYQQDHGEALYRRSIYSYWRRTVAPPSMVNFDSPTRETCTVRTSRTNTPLQALNLMNDITYLEAARKLAERMLEENPSDPLAHGYRLVLAREPRAEERAAIRKLLDRNLSRYRRDPRAAAELLTPGEAPRAALDVSELAAWTTAASLLLNLDEAVTKP